MFQSRIIKLPVMTRDIVPLDSVPVLVVEHRQAGLVVPLLEALDRQADGVAHLCEFARTDAFEVVGLALLQSAKVDCREVNDRKVFSM